jgi:hypothetical protein
MEDIDIEDPGTINRSKNKRAILKHLREKSTTTAVVLAKLGLEVCTACGWQPITSRSDPNGQFGTEIRPLNWYSPIETTMKRLKKTKPSGTTEMTICRNAMLDVVLATVGDTVPAGSVSNYGTTNPN